MSIIIPETLFLRDVYVSDLATLENIFDAPDDEYSLDDDSLSTTYFAENDDLDSIIYDKIPRMFINMDNWPENTNVKCYNCTLRIKGPPIPIAISIDIGKNREKIFDVKTVCCTFVCAATWITENIYDSGKRWNMLEMLKMIRYIFYKAKYYTNNIKNIDDPDDDYPGIMRNDNKEIITKLDVAINSQLEEGFEKIIRKDIPVYREKSELCMYGGDISKRIFEKEIHKREFLNDKNQIY